MYRTHQQYPSTHEAKTSNLLSNGSNTHKNDEFENNYWTNHAPASNFFDNDATKKAKRQSVVTRMNNSSLVQVTENSAPSILYSDRQIHHNSEEYQNDKLEEPSSSRNNTLLNTQLSSTEPDQQVLPQQIFGPNIFKEQAQRRQHSTSLIDRFNNKKNSKLQGGNQGLNCR